MQRSAFSPDTLKRLSELEARLRYRFRDISLLATALTHSSWANEHNTVHNERLEFLGDAVLEVNVSHEIYKRFPKERERIFTANKTLCLEVDEHPEVRYYTS